MRAKHVQSATVLASSRWLPLVGLWAASLLGCAQTGEPAGEVTGSALAELRDYERDAKPLLERYCTTCHREGGIGPFSLTDYDSARTHASAIEASVKAGRMPPWLPSKEGVPLRYSRAMHDDDKAALLQWVRDGALPGEKALWLASHQRLPTPWCRRVVICFWIRC